MNAAFKFVRCASLPAVFCGFFCGRAVRRFWRYHSRGSYSPFLRNQGAVRIDHRFAVEPQINRFDAPCFRALLTYIVQHRKKFVLEIAVAKVHEDRSVGSRPLIIG